MLKSPETSYRIAFIIYAVAWSAICLPLLLALVLSSGTTFDLNSASVILLTVLATIGAVGSVWYKKWAALLYVLSHSTLLLMGIVKSHFDIPWWSLFMVVVFVGFVLNCRDKFKF